MHVYIEIKIFIYSTTYQPVSPPSSPPVPSSFPSTPSPFTPPSSPFRMRQASYGLAQIIAYQLKKDLAPPLIYVKAGAGNTTWGTCYQNQLAPGNSPALTVRSLS